jgi:molybdopterin molybdotransferase
MARLIDDCLASGESSMTLDDAVALIEARFPICAGIETVALQDADGRILAQDVTAGINLPPFDNSAVDGYAVRYADLAPLGETVLPVRGRIAAGATEAGLAAACAVRIFTGAPMPAGADTVFMQEDVVVDGAQVVLPTGLKAGANRRVAGEDVACGATVLAAGRRLTPQDVALAAAVGHHRLAVRRRLRVAVFSTGDEVAEPGAALRPGAIHDSNRVMLIALLRRFGTEVHDLGILRDDAAQLGSRLAECARSYDLILTSGGVSVGEEDHVRPAVEAVGRLVFWRLRIKPGRPVAMGVIGDTAFVGLPGNPVAAYVTLMFLVRPLIARLAGATVRPPLAIPVRAGFTHAKRAGRREFLRVVLHRASDGSLEAHKVPTHGAAGLASLAASDALAILAEDVTALQAGDTVDVILHDRLG